MSLSALSLLFALLFCSPFACKSISVSLSSFDQTNWGNFSVMFDLKGTPSPMRLDPPTTEGSSIKLVDGGDQTGTAWLLPYLLPIDDPFSANYSIELTKTVATYVQAQPDFCFVVQSSSKAWELIEDQGDWNSNGWRNLADSVYGFGFCIDPFTCTLSFSTSNLANPYPSVSMDGCTAELGLDTADSVPLFVSIVSDGHQWSVDVSGAASSKQSISSGNIGPLSALFASKSRTAIVGVTSSGGELAQGVALLRAFTVSASNLVPASQTCGPPPPLLAGKTGDSSFLYCNGTTWIYTNGGEVIFEDPIIDFDDGFQIVMQVPVTTISTGTVVRITSISNGTLTMDGKLVIAEGVTLRIVLNETSSVSQTLALPIQANGINGTFSDIKVELSPGCRKLSSVNVVENSRSLGLDVFLVVDDSGCATSKGKRSTRKALIIGLSVGLGVVVLTIGIIFVLLRKGLLRRSSLLFTSVESDADVLTI